VEQILTGTAAVASAAAVLFMTFVALGVILGANQLRDVALRLVGGAVVIAVLARGCVPVVGDMARSVPAHAGATSGTDGLICVTVALGHVVLGIVLLARWLRPRAGVERAEERRRARMRERVRVPPRDHELDP